MAESLTQHRDWQPLVGYRRYIEMVTTRSLPSYSQVSGRQIRAYVNDGRWVVQCPTGDGGALVLDLAEPYFICPECGNRGDDGSWHEVLFPPARAMAAIEAALLARPDRANRNWTYGETVRDLRSENALHGVG